MWSENKKCPFPRFPGFRFFPMLESENLETLEVFFYFKFLSFQLHEAWERLKPFIEFQISRPHALMPHVKHRHDIQRGSYLCMFLSQ